ncbi:MAG: hypothetical protein ACI8R8_001294, partial [Paraglaciecola sp.]
MPFPGSLRKNPVSLFFIAPDGEIFSHRPKKFDLGNKRR